MQKQSGWSTQLESLPSLYEQDDAVISGIRPPPAPLEVAAAVSGEFSTPSLDPVDATRAETSMEEPSVDPPTHPAPRNERRVFSRQPLDGELELTINGAGVSVLGVDISRGGLQCHPLPHWTRRGDPVLIHLPHPHRQVLGRVAWVRSRSQIESVKIAGIRFSSPLPFLH